MGRWGLDNDRWRLVSGLPRPSFGLALHLSVYSIHSLSTPFIVCASRRHPLTVHASCIDYTSVSLHTVLKMESNLRLAVHCRLTSKSAYVRHVMSYVITFNDSTFHRDRQSMTSLDRLEHMIT